MKCAALFLTVALGCISPATSLSQSPACDRNCLTHLADQYLAAMVKHDPAGLPMAAKYRYTENTATLPLGDGLWVGASNLSTFKIYIVDPQSGQVGFMGVLREFGKPVLLTLRLKEVDGKITEIEHDVVRQIGGSSGTPGHMNLVSARSAFSESVPPSERVSREELLRIANSYFDSIEQSNGKVAPFADDCVRHENGAQTTTWDQPDPLSDPLTNAVNALGCAAQIDAGELSYITAINPRRLAVVDEEKGMVLAFPMFVHRGNVRSVKLVGVPGFTSQPKEFAPFNNFAGEVFKIRGGKIHEIEAFGTMMPVNALSGWD